VPVQPESFQFGECAVLGQGQYDCGPPPYRVICYPPFGVNQNSNWWVDIDRSFNPPPDWRVVEVTEITSTATGAIIKAGQTTCAG
jgi:hypothetical protein